MKRLQCTIKPLSGFHLQSGGAHHESSSAFISSDTLSAAITHWWIRQYGTDSFSAAAPPFQLSSTMPVLSLDQDQSLKLYPKPAHLWQMPSNLLAEHKRIKKVEWISPKVLKGIQSGQDLAHLFSDSNYVSAASGQVLLHASECEDNHLELLTGQPLYHTKSRPRVTLDRQSQAAVPFHFAGVYYPKHTKLWFMVEVDEGHYSKFKAILRLLGDEGIGGDRTVGYGQFLIEHIEESTLDNAKASNQWLNLGLYAPNETAINETKWDESYFNWASRGGWTLNGSLRRKRVRCLTEGASLHTATKPQGQVVEVLSLEDGNHIVENRIGHPVYRDLRGFFIPLN